MTQVEKKTLGPCRTHFARSLKRQPPSLVFFSTLHKICRKQESQEKDPRGWSHATALIGAPSHPVIFRGSRLTITSSPGSAASCAACSKSKFVRFSTITPPAPRIAEWTPKSETGSSPTVPVSSPPPHPRHCCRRRQTRARAGGTGRGSSCPSRRRARRARAGAPRRPPRARGGRSSGVR